MSNLKSAGRTTLSAIPLPTRRRTVLGYLSMPVLLLGTCLALYLWIESRTLDSIESRSLNWTKLSTTVWRHVELTVVSTFLVVLIAVPVGVLLTRPFARRVKPIITSGFNLGQAIPTIGIFVLLAVAFLFLGFHAAVVGLVLYTIMPVLVNTIAGLEQISPSILEAGKGMGMSKLGVLRKIELPLAVPVIVAGVRTALIINVGSAALATYINAGGLGDIIVAGLSTNRTSVQVVGAVLTGVLALSIDYAAGLAEDILRPKGM